MSKNLLIFAGNDFISHQFLNRIIPCLVKSGISPIIIKVNNKAHHWEHPEMKRYAFYEDTLLNEHLMTYIEDNPSPIYNLRSLGQLQSLYKLKVIDCKNVNAPEFIDHIKDLDFIGAISIRCFQIFKKNLIQFINTKGFFCNSHPGTLPNYRGVYCLLRGMISQEKQLGWSLHVIEEGIDTGNVVKTATIPNDPNNNMLQNFSNTIPQLVDAWLEYITEYLDDKNIESIPQLTKSNYYTYPTKLEIDEWLSNGRLKPLSSKALVKYYCDLFYSEENKHTSSAQNLKVFLINKVAQFETMLELDNAKTSKALPQKKAA